MLREITPAQLKDKLTAGKTLQLIDVREAAEFDICHIAGSQLLPLSTVASHVSEIDKQNPVVVICHHGYRSAQAIQYLNQRFGYENLLNLKGGIHQWALQVDPAMTVY